MRTTLGFGLMAAMTLSTMAVAAPSAATADYLKKAGAGDQFEIQSSKLVLSSTKDAHVRQFADKMIADHMKSTAMVKSAAKEASIMPKPPMLDAQQKSDLSALKAASGSARDKLYWTQQKTAHQEALAAHQQYSQTGDTPSLKKTAGEIVPVVQSHITMLNQHSM